MDMDIARWVLEFLFRQSIDDCLLNTLVGALPLSDDHPSLKKTILVRRIESEIESVSVSEKVLELLELIEQLDYEEGIAASEAMKAAYCAVAVDCTARFLDGNKDEEWGYFHAVKRIWRDRFREIEKWENIGFVSDELRSWRDKLEAAIWDASVRENLRKRKEGNHAVEAVRVYVAEVWASMGPPFLELVAQTMGYDKLKVLGMNKVGERVTSLADADHNKKGEKEMQKGNTLHKRKNATGRCSRGPISKTARGVHITDNVESDSGTTYNKYDCPPTIIVNKIQEELRSSSLQLQAMVKDPLPDALKLAEAIIMQRGKMNHKPMVENQNKVDVHAVNTSVDKSAEVAEANEGNIGNQCCSHQNEAPRPSLMSRNGTACTYEWDDSIDNLSEGSPDGQNRVHLPSPNRRIVSPLKKYEMPKLSKRRKAKKWSLVEEDTLRTGVAKYGVGNWAIILKSYPDEFEERTAVDLKDKWRNMTRY
ncbi:uncharacterized protein LOC132269258 [Cornus florida]|uniref:uncharacterized protein LOC132269258 n=1 Tax=Cornus florida TaxID=4283 RepID=UPI0028994987|nr:uncharacterized protein LOC132269258 [Cornus florida]XP_059626376.1 uncharacterized protein LOC132269258 [Cornus florida]